MNKQANNSGPTARLSVVVPVFNEADGLRLLWEKLSSVLAGLGEYWEVVFVDDGSHDSSWSVLKQLHEQNPQVRALRLSRNFGHQTALTAGMEAARGAVIITMDADLQHPPDLIPELVRQWQAGHQIVHTVRQHTVDASPFKRFSSWAFYWLINHLGGTRIEPNTADFRLLDRQVIDALRAMPEHRRFLRGMINWLGFRQCAVPFQAPPRAVGTTKYSLRRMVRLALDAVLSFSTLPLRLAIYMGLLIALGSFLYLGFVLYAALFTDRAVAGWASVIGVLLFLGAIQLLFTGLIGEYIARIYEETRQRPLYLVAERIGWSEPPDA